MSIIESIIGKGNAAIAAKLANRIQTTGVLEGGVISQASATTLDWTSGEGQIVDYTDPLNPVVTYPPITWDAVSGYTPTNIATDGTTVFGYDLNGNLVEILTPILDILDTKRYILIGSATHISGTIISIITAPGNLGYDGVGSFFDFINLVIGPSTINGNIYGANGTNLNLDVVGGRVFIPASNFRNDPQISDTPLLSSEIALTFTKVYREAVPSKSIVYEGTATEMDPTKYDNGSGTLQTVTAGYWTIQRIFRGRTGTTFVSYGQEEFATKIAALEALGKEAFEEKSPLPLTLYRCSLVVSQSATDLSNTTQAEFFKQSSFRIGGAVSATSTIPGISAPGGPNNAIQFNDGGAFGGSSDLTWLGNVLSILNASVNIVNGQILLGDAIIEHENVTHDPIQLSGSSGLDDAGSSGLYTLSGNAVFQIRIDGIGSPNTFEWRKGTSGSYTTGIAMTGSAQLLQDGISITWAATTGHTNNDEWEMNVGHEIHINEALHVNADITADGDVVVVGTLRSLSPVKIQEGIDILCDVPTDTAVINTTCQSMSLELNDVVKILISSGGIDIPGNSLSVGRGIIPATGSDRAAFNFGGGGSLIGATSDTDALLLSNAYYNSGYKYLTPDFASAIKLDNGEITLMTAPSGAINTAIPWIDRLVIQSNGIGVEGKLDVKGSTVFGLRPGVFSQTLTNATTMISPTAETNPATGPEGVLRLVRVGTSGTKYHSSADIEIGSYEDALSSRTQLNIRLGHGNTATPDTDIVSLRSNGYVGVGTDPLSAVHIKSNTPGTVGSHPAGQLLIQSPGTSDNSNVVIAGYASDAQGNPYQQLWYLGSGSSSNADITFLNRLDASLHLGTNAVTRVTVDNVGNIGMNGTSFGGGVKTMFIANATTIPTTDPTGGGILYVEGGALKFRGSSGTTTTIAAP